MRGEQGEKFLRLLTVCRAGDSAALIIAKMEIAFPTKG